MERLKRAVVVTLVKAGRRDLARIVAETVTAKLRVPKSKLIALPWPSETRTRAWATPRADSPGLHDPNFLVGLMGDVVVAFEDYDPDAPEPPDLDAREVMGYWAYDMPYGYVLAEPGGR